MRVLVAADSFKETLSARDAADAIARGWRRGDPSAQLETVAVADGGEGTLEALLTALGGETRRAEVTGPLGDRVRAPYALVVEPDGTRTAVLETAAASGLALVSPVRRDPLRATTFGTGQLILHALRERPDRVLVGAGGSATVDGGAGAAAALGVRLLDEHGNDVPPGGRALERLAGVDVRGIDPAAKTARVVVACDVDNQLLGPEGAAAAYGPQKGASAEGVRALERALGRLAAVIERDLGIDVRGLPGGGAAGGLPAGLAAFCGAHVRRGADLVLETLGLEERVAASDVVVTGEGRFDRGSLRGKAAGAVTAMAGRLGVPVALLCGEIDPSAAAGARWTFSLAERFGRESALREPAEGLERLAEQAARAIGEERRGGRG